MKKKYTIHKDGSVTVEVLDFQGPDCVEKTKGDVTRLGTQQGEHVLKPEYYEEPEVVEEREVQR